MANQVRVGVIGTGGISRYHMGGWLRSKRGKLVAAADIQPDKLQAFCEEFDLPPQQAYGDPRKMLLSEALDCVSVCCWAQHHADMVVAAARAGVEGVLCEKPLGYSIAEGERMRRAADKHGTKVLVMHQRRYVPTYTEAARLIARGAIGQVHTLVARNGGGLCNTHSHSVDMMRYVLGDPRAEWAMAQLERRTNRWERCHPVEDCLVGVIGFEGGARGIIESDTPLEKGQGGLWVYGTEGAIALYGGPLRMNQNTGGTWEPIEAGESVDPPVAYVQDLLRWMDGGPEPRISLAKAWHTHEILMAFYESARTHRRITFPVRNRKRILEQMIDDGLLPLGRRKKPYDIRTPDALDAGYR
ncbi:MAG: Gfo/Idh/MocA family protein [Planctomycetota bacterium]